MSKIDITIISCVYNKGQYIEQALTSILQQNTHYSYKLVIIDDCSSDNSLQLIKDKFSHLFDNIEIIENNPNLGYFNSLLLGFKKINTKFYTILDPDDYWCSRQFLEKSISFLEKHSDFSLFFGNTYIQTNSKKTLMHNHDSISLDLRHLTGHLRDSIMMHAHTSSTVFRSNGFTDEIFKKLSHLDSQYYKIYEGDSFRHRLFSQSGKTHYCNEVMGVYNYDMTGIWSSLNKQEKFRREIDMSYECYWFLKTLHLSISYCLLRLVFQISAGFIVEQNTQILIDTMKNRKNTTVIQDLKKSGAYYNFTFFLPSLILGDDEHMFIMWANYLSDVLGISCIFITLPDSPIENFLSNDIKVLYINDSSEIIELPPYSKVFAPIVLAYDLPEFHSKGFIEISFWVTHTCSMELLMTNTSQTYDGILKFISLANQDNCLTYMNETCFKATQKYTHLELKEHYLPVSVEKNLQKISISKIKNELEINIGWFGQLNGDNIHSVLNLLEKLTQYETSKKIYLHIIGDGHCISMIKQDKCAPNITILIIDKITDSDARHEYIKDNVDLVVAVGMSALVGASLSKPTILPLINIQNDLDTDSFLWLFNTNKYTLGSSLNDMDLTKYQTLQTTLDDIYVYNKFDTYKKQSFDYVKNNHSLHNNILLLLKNLISKYKSLNGNSSYDHFYALRYNNEI